MKTKLAKLIDVKSIMTLLLTVVFCVLAVTGVVSADQFVTIFTVIVGFYFGTQSQKKVGTTAAVYTGAQQSEPVADSSEPIYGTSDPMTANEAHPPDGEADVWVNKIGFEY